MAAALVWRCDANAAPAPPAELTDFADPLFRQLHHVLQRLPDKEPTREILTLQAAEMFAPMLRVAPAKTTVTATDCYLCALHQVAEVENDPWYIAYGDRPLPKTARDLTPAQRGALMAKGPILILLNANNAMGPDALVLAYGSGALAASCKADNAGQGGHVEALCKLGIVTAPSAYGGAFPVVQYAMVHGIAENETAKERTGKDGSAKGGTAKEGTGKKSMPSGAVHADTHPGIVQSLETLLKDARTFQGKEIINAASFTAFAKEAQCKKWLNTALQESHGKSGVVPYETFAFYWRGLKAFLELHSGREGFSDISYIAATHGTASLGLMPLPTAPTSMPLHRFQLKKRRNE